ncbi:YheV family putative metal-binding protein [Alcanivorax sp. VBW004]|uniref:YheV family putative zinc ribbon protein n=1 Tax=Alcanivorax sp. VBW004 TaxID=1287708 RepID=UPI0012BD7140|nr:YheV family putative zinc ribbon protein [Alcanivorax sp. VBW004]MTT50854.1 YheV family putative metal-binding protein [Alcanivorax sp. VBW004]
MKRQFIAGATCPECGQQDKIQRIIDGDIQWMECVACGAKKNLDDKPPETTDALAQPVTLQPGPKK